MKSDRAALLQVVSEAFFVLVPIIVVFLLGAIAGHTGAILRNTEFSFAAIVLFGQAIVKFTAGAAKNRKRKKWQVISVVTSGILVFGIVPSTTLLIKIFEMPAPPSWLYWLQGVLFALSFTVFVVLGTVGQMYLDEPTE